MFELNNFDSMKIGIASPEKIRQWSYGEVTKAETINYRTQKPEKDGLFCERIFGPAKDYECHCGKYKRIRYAGTICDKCGVEVTKSKVRRERMGHIELAAPVSHIWFFRGVPSKIGLVLEMSPKPLEQVIYFGSYVVMDPGQTDLKYKDVITDKVYYEELEKFPNSGLKVGIGAEAIRELLMAVDLNDEAKKLRERIDSNQSSQQKAKDIKRLEIIEWFLKSGQRPEWMILTVLPVIPPELRPMVQLDGGRFATSDLNDLYRRVITRNNRLRKFIEAGAADIIIRNEKRMLQEAVDTLIDNGKRGKAVTGAGSRELKSLSAYLRGKQGRFRMNLLGKRVDYSGRSVIVVGPELKIHQCGLPREMAIELFKPFVMKRLVEDGTCNNIKSAKRTVERLKPCVWDILEDIIKDHPVLLNRAPTLHRLSIQAFEPVLIEGRAIKLHPLVCTAFNADFDGDQMAVHVPLSIEAQAEARFLMLSSNNVLKLSDGKPVMSPSQDMVLGCYYLTISRKSEGKYYAKNAYYEYIENNGKFYKNDEKIKIVDGVIPKEFEEFIPSEIVYDNCNRVASCTLTSVATGKVEKVTRYVPQIYKSEKEAFVAYQTKNVHIQDEIILRRTVEIPEELANDNLKGIVTRTEDGKTLYTYRVRTTVGKIIFNREIPQDLGFQKRETADDYLKYEIDMLCGKKQLKKIVEACFNKKSAKCAVETLDYIKSLGYKYSTIGSITTSIFDMNVPEIKNKIIEDADKEVIKIEKQFNRGFITDNERYKAVVDVWTEATDHVSKELAKTLDKFNPIWMMADSGARGSIDQIKQLSGMRGLMTNPNGKIIETPVKSCFREGLTVLEYFTSSHGGRKGLADTALKTADSGYLTRRLVDVSHPVIIKEEDCFATLGEKPKGRFVEEIRIPGKKEPIESLEDRIVGRYTIEDILDPTTGEVLVPADTMISNSQAKLVGKSGVKGVWIRTLFTCASRIGVCAKCYGRNMSNLSRVQIGEAVGTIAAQSIGEPGTQLTMRTFHTGGIASTGDITQGLPRIEELFEVRRPAGQAVLSDESGVVEIKIKDGLRRVIVKGEKEKEFIIPFRADLLVKNGDKVEPGDVLTSGSIYPQEILLTKGAKATEDYILNEVQKVYRSQGVEINDKHVEIIVRQMLKKVLIQKSGDTSFLPGEKVDEAAYREANKIALENGKVPAQAERIMLGITKAALATDSFLSAASFQETTKVLTDAAISGKVDHLVGLKENIIIGKLIPAGTGAKEYRNILPQINRFETENPLIDEEEPNEEIDG